MASQLPTYVPLDISTREFAKLNSYLLDDKELRETCDEILASAKEYLDGIIEEDFSINSVREDGELNRLDPIKTLVRSYEQLIITRLETRYFQDAFSKGKEDIIERSCTEPPLNVENVAKYVELSKDTKDLAELIEDNIQKSQISESMKRKTLEGHTDYKYLKNATIIIDHPLQPLSNEGEEDDDLEMAGGTVDLKCPVTLKTFENPYISKLCQHGFDLEAINNLWKDNMPLNCPVPGCKRSLRKSDFEQDRIMSLRVKAWARLQIKLEKEQNYERI